MFKDSKLQTMADVQDFPFRFEINLSELSTNKKVQFVTCTTCSVFLNGKIILLKFQCSIKWLYLTALTNGVPEDIGFNK